MEKPEDKSPSAHNCALEDALTKPVEPVEGHDTSRECADGEADREKLKERSRSASASPTRQLALSIPVVPDTTLLTEAETCLENLRKWRLQQEQSLQEQLNNIEKVEVNPSTPAINTEELDDLLVRGNSVIQQIQATRSGLRKEIESVQSVSVAAKEQGLKFEDVQAPLAGLSDLPQISNLTEEIAKMELQVACLAEMQQVWEEEQKETEAQLEQLHTEIGEYCSIIEEALEETTRNEAIIGLLHRQDRRGEEQKDSAGPERPVPPAKAASPANCTDKGLGRSDSSTTDLDEFIDSVLLQCAEVDNLLNVALQPIIESDAAEPQGATAL
ncbi:hypothetical protein CSUI_000712 [Cystoisospora suis]|uniref:Uncharacterized protein n=1 Tax=Cystoisospora suis TaxID=483139 RepID=A0A2C6KN40_9APIC|nr:hypothetical protein CSUI_000712 [Cystoisospora suis]